VGGGSKISGLKDAAAEDPAIAGAKACSRRPSVSFLWEIAIDFVSVENPDESNGLAFNNQAEPVITGPDTEIGTFRFQFFQVVDCGKAFGDFDLENDLLNPGQEIFVFTVPL
jgi:hypothetical protein